MEGHSSGYRFINVKGNETTKTSKGLIVEMSATNKRESSPKHFCATYNAISTIVLLRTKNRLFTAGNCKAKYTLPTNLKTKVAQTIIVES